MNQRGNRSGWLITALVIVAIIVFRGKMVPNILVPSAPQIKGTDYQFTASMHNPSKKGLSWVLSRRGDQTQYIVEVYNNQQPVRAFSTPHGKAIQTPGHQYPCNGTIKINGFEYQASTLLIRPDGKSGVLTLMPPKNTTPPKQ